MLSLLSRIVTGGESEENPYRGEDHELSSSPDSSPSVGDTDEELVNETMPVINIDQTELAQEAIDVIPSNSNVLSSSDQTDSCEDAKEDPTSEVKKVEDETPVVIPSRDVCQRIVELIEFYLSDANLVKDMFLLKHVTKHREGYVSLKLLTSYKKVKRLTKDWRVVAHSLKSSYAIELNADGTKARRRMPLPPELEEDTRPFRTLLATHISPEKASMNQLAELFGKFGDMMSLQVHKPGGRTLNEVRQAERQFSGIVDTVCAVIEYEKVHCARQALKFVSNSTEDCQMKVMELPRKKRESLLGVKGKVDSESAYYSNSEYSEPPSPIIPDRLRHHRRWMTSSCSIPSSPSISPMVGRRKHKPVNSSPESSPPSPYRSNCGGSTPCSSPEESLPPRPFSSHDHYHFNRRFEVPGSLPLPRRKLTHMNPEVKTDSPRSRGRNQDSSLRPLSPWLRKREMFNRGDGVSPINSPCSSPNLRRRNGDFQMLLPENVTRFPKGPDGTKGFAIRRSFAGQAKA